ncbi:branched-chain amino acid ABC transporter permease [Intestinimonas butyriciproducens]|uniref:Amino acid/amide ABC transporter membrane protein 1 (HAAT family) n=2 Tax=Intestinimonas butyriciproducens TaxID=1297617 RepID=A0A0S2W8E1_9FIRM|nr:branched-chain amino acid ABC transporter permease [Intestinimonas butyriciproducens]ALP95587.1 High-affinity branched-chain amino acid transport system permease protein LivH [Intestinimonas butyriciproducens]MBU5230434.1 branched-chain amino acid ABC transporter permease [Intestinimonas butyriciproducens]MCI6362661.1 branched-chain amino acid ABC transporter permease [Intestinimonas butyriciproducens]MCR1907170.1 branched-chain amino acid ABC transporter permease [Intestinimonas butyricipro
MEFLTKNLSYLLAGISVGGQYALIAIGYTMVYGILRLINFAHGDVFMVAGLMMVYLSASLPLWIAIPLVLLLTVLLGFLIERVAYKPLRTAPRMSVMISAIGVSYLLQNLALYVTGGLNKNYPAIPGISEQVTIGPATTKVVTLVTPVLTIVLVVVLMQLINHTKTGMAMRAVAKDFETSQLMGIKINSVISVTFIIGSFLAAVGSLLYFTNYPGVVPTSGAMPGLKAFVAAVFGGIGSIPGAVVGAFLIGICENIIKGLDDMLVQLGVIQTGLGLTTFSDAFTFALLIVILIAKPTGLFGEKATDKV